MDWYVVHLYVEGGEYDGEVRALGSLEKDKAEYAANELADFGTATVIPLAESLDDIKESLR